MLDTAKYIIFNRNRFVIFDSLFKHSEMANHLKLTNEDIVSAGFVMICDGAVVCFGESISLNKKPNPEDNLILNKWL